MITSAKVTTSNAAYWRPDINFGVELARKRVN